MQPTALYETAIEVQNSHERNLNLYNRILHTWTERRHIEILNSLKVLEQTSECARVDSNIMTILNLNAGPRSIFPLRLCIYIYLTRQRKFCINVHTV